MRRILYLAAIASTVGIGASVHAQGGGMGGMGGGTSFSGGGTGATGGTSFSGGGTGATGGTSFSGGTGATGGTSFTGTGTGPGTTTVPGRTGAGGRTLGGAGGVSISPTNFMAATYGNPLYPGRPGSTNLSPLAGGGFAQASFGATTTTGARTATTAAGGRIAGGTATVGSYTGTYTQILPITYTTEVKFPVAPIRPPEVQAELQGIINRTSALRQPSNVRIEVSGTTVILRGRVADDDERRLVEGMVRMEPGVRDVRNELTIP